MKKRFSTIALCLLCFNLSAQEWVISYVGEHLLGLTTLVDGFIDEEGVTFLAGREGTLDDASNALLMRIEPDGAHKEYRHFNTNSNSEATCIIEMNDHNLFVAGNSHDGVDDYVMVLILDKQLNLIEEHHYAKEVEAVSFRECKATLDSHEHVIVATAVLQNNPYQGFDLRGVFFKFNNRGDMISRRYLIEEYPHPLYFIMDFRLRQMWYQEESETLLTLSTGYGGVLSFVTYDSAFNYIEEHPIWRDIDRSDHTINREDCYTDHWYNAEEALFFSSRGDYNHNKLRVSRINTQGEFLDFICLNERTDTIDDAAKNRCMACPNDTTYYFLFHYHTMPLFPGIGCVYQLNNRQEIIGRHLDDEHQCYQSRIILPTAENGCIVVYDSCRYQAQPHNMHPVIKKLSPFDFEKVYVSVGSATDNSMQHVLLFPNPVDNVIQLNLNLQHLSHLRLRIIDAKGLILADRLINPNDTLIQVDISLLKPGVYQYQLYSNEKIIQADKFIKK